MSDEELIEIGETAVTVLGNSAGSALLELEGLLAEYDSLAEIRSRLQRLDQLEERLENLEEAVDFDHLREILKNLRAALKAAEKLQEALSDAEDGLVSWSTDLHATLK